MTLRRHGSWGFLWLWLAACGTAPAAPAVAPSAEPAAAASDESAPAPGDGSAPEKPAPAAPAADKSEPRAPTGRDIVYHKDTDGLIIEVGGVEFKPSASAVRVGGGWGVKVTVETTVQDSSVHILLNPKNGPLMFAAKSESGDMSGDKREGDAQLTLTPGSTKKLSRTWPASPKAALENGQSLQLHVGLWGLGDDPSSQKPVRVFFMVKLKVEKGKASAVAVLPPGVE